MAGKYRENKREKHIRKFTVKKLLTSYLIMYDGDILVRVRLPRSNDKEKATRLRALPDGFIERLAGHIAEVCVGRHSIVWDQQAVFGAPRSNTKVPEKPCP